VRVEGCRHRVVAAYAITDEAHRGSRARRGAEPTNEHPGDESQTAYVRYSPCRYAGILQLDK